MTAAQVQLKLWLFPSRLELRLNLEQFQEQQLFVPALNKLILLQESLAPPHTSGLYRMDGQEPAPPIPLQPLPVQPEVILL